MKNKFAMFIRIISIPPFMVTYLLAGLYLFREGVFANSGEFIAALLFLAVIPALAYPFAEVVPPLKKGGRPMQRKIAFLFSVIGYIGGFIYALTAGFSKPVLTIFTAYLASLLFLVLFYYSLLSPLYSILKYGFILCLLAFDKQSPDDNTKHLLNTSFSAFSKLVILNQHFMLSQLFL